MRIHAKPFLNSLKRVGKAVNRNSIIPANLNVLVADGCVTATNLNLTIIDRIDTLPPEEIQLSPDERICLPYDKFVAYVSTQSGMLDIQKSGKVKGDSNRDFPEFDDPKTFSVIDKMEDAIQVKVSEKFIVSLLKAVKCIERYEGNWSENVHILIRDEKLVIEASDRVAIFYEEFSPGKCKEVFDISVPSDVLQSLIVDECTMFISKKRIGFKYANTFIMGMLRDEPKFIAGLNTLFEAPRLIIAKFNRDDLQEALNRVDLIDDFNYATKQKISHPTFSFTQTTCTLTEKSTTTPDATEAEVSVITNGDIDPITVKGEVIKRVLSLFPDNTEEVTFHIEGKNKGFMITAPHTSLKFLVNQISNI